MKAKQLLSLFLAVLMIFSMIPAVYADGTAGTTTTIDAVIYTAQDLANGSLLTYSNMKSNGLKVEEDSTGYKSQYLEIQSTANADQTNNLVRFQINPVEVDQDTYPVIAVSYKANFVSANNGVMVPKATGEFFATVAGFGSTADNTKLVSTYDSSEKTNMTGNYSQVQIRPWGSATNASAATSADKFDVEYIGFFKTVEDAAAYQYGVGCTVTTGDKSVTTTTDNVVVDVKATYSNVGGVDYMNVYVDSEGNPVAGPFVPTEDVELTAVSYEINVFTAEQLYSGTAQHSSFFPTRELITDTDGTQWLRVANNEGVKYNECFRITLPHTISSEKFEEVAVGYRTDKTVTTTGNTYFSFYTPISTSFGYNAADPGFAETSKTTAASYSGTAVVDVTPATLNSKLTNDLVSGVAQVSRLKVFPWNQAFTPTTTGTGAYFDMEYLAVFAADGVASYFDYDEYVEAKKVTVTVLNADGTTNTKLTGRYMPGDTIDLPIQSGKYFVSYINADTNEAFDGTVTTAMTVKPDPASKEKIVLFSAHDGTLTTTATKLTKTEDTFSNVPVQKFTSETATIANDIRINVDFRDGTTPREKLTYANYPHMVFGYQTNMTAGRADGANRLARLGFTTYPTATSFASGGDDYKNWEQTLTITPDSKFHNQYFASAKYSDSATYNALPVTHMDIRAWGVAATGSIAVNDYFALGYVGFFKTKAQAEAFDYEEYANAIEVVIKDQDGNELGTEYFNAKNTGNVINLTNYNVTTPTGKVFVGWAPDGNEEVVIVLENAAAVAVTKDVVYTPVFGDKTAITFYAADGTTPITAEIETTDATPIKDIVANTAAAAYEYTKSTEVFAGWQDMASGKVYAKNDTITGTVSVKATYSEAYIVPATELDAKLKGSISDSHGSFALVDDANGVPQFRITQPEGSTMYNGHRFAYVLKNSATIDITNKPYLAVKASANTLHRSFMQYMPNKTNQTYVAAATEEEHYTIFTMYNDSVAAPGDTVTGFRFAPYAGDNIGEAAAKASIYDIEYVAFLEKTSAAEYVDVVNMDMVNVTLDGKSVKVAGGKSLAEYVETKQFKDEDGSYKIVAGFTVNNAAQPIDYKAAEGDVITTTYANAYVFTPYMLSHSAVYNDTKGEVVNGYLRITSTKEAGHKYATTGEWGSVFAYFQITDEDLSDSVASDAPFVKGGFAINDAPYYSITYNTNIDAGQFSNNMYAYYSNKWDRLFPSETRVLNTDREFGVDMLTHNALESADKEQGITAVRFGIYHQGRMNDTDETNDLTVTAEDYFDIKYLGFFPSKASEAVFDYAKYLEDTKVTPNVTVDGVAVEISEKYNGEAYELPEAPVVANKAFVGYMNADNEFVSTVHATANETALTTVYKNTNVLPADYTVEAGNLANLAAAAADGSLTVAYIGGSITEGSAAPTVDTAYAGRVTAAIEDLGINVTPYYMGLGGTGSRLGAHRLADDIIANAPELVVIDFAINDSYCKEVDAEGNYNGIYYEYILRTIRKELPDTEIVVTLTTDINRVGVTGKDDTFDIAKAQAALAAHYDATSIDLGRYIAAVIEKDGDFTANWNVFFDDPVHPTELGHQIYADAIAAYLAGATSATGAAASYTVPATVLYEGANTLAPATIALDKVTIIDGFEYNATATQGNSYTGKLVPVANSEAYAFEFDFTGTELSLYMNSPNDEVNITVAIDGMDSVTQTGKATTNGPKVFYDNLPYGTYHATVSFDAMPTSGGNIIAICVGGQAKLYTVTVKATVGGQVCNTEGVLVDEYKISVPENEVISLDAEAQVVEGITYTFRNWYDITNGRNVAIEYDDDMIPATYPKTTYKVTKNTILSANFVDVAASLPIKLIAFVDGSANGTISGKYSTETYLVPGTYTVLTAEPNDGYSPYWVRITSEGDAVIFESVDADLNAYPLGGSVFYQPKFVNTTTTIYIDDITREIIGVVSGDHSVDTQPAAPGRNGYAFNEYVEVTSEGIITVMKTSYKKSAGSTDALKIYGYNAKGELELIESAFSPANGEGYTVSTANASPKWTMTVNGNTFVVSYSSTFNFNYMFKEGTAVVVEEGTAESGETVAIGTAAAWKDGNYAHFTGAWAVNGIDHVEHGILMSTDSDKLKELNAGTTFNPDATVIVGRVSNTTDPSAVYTISKKLDTTSNDTWYGRAYLVYTEGGINKVIYGDTVDMNGNVIVSNA